MKMIGVFIIHTTVFPMLKTHVGGRKEKEEVSSC